MDTPYKTITNILEKYYLAKNNGISFILNIISTNQM